MKKFICISLLAIISYIGTISFCEAAVWKFVVMADNQDNTNLTTTGVNAQVPVLVNYIIAENPDLVVCAGDPISGWDVAKSSLINGNYDQMYQTWLQYMQPLTNKKIPFYVIRGNHDYGAIGVNYLTRLFTSYKKNIAAIMPQNGQAVEAGLSYTVNPPGRKAKFIMLDSFYNDPTTGIDNGSVGINTSWLESELSSGGIASGNFVFVFSHSPAYQVNTGNPGYTLYSQTALRNTFWNLLTQYQATAYFCGHVHLYCRAVADGIPQFVVGTGGGVFDGYTPQGVDASLSNVFPTVAVPKNDWLHGYLVVTVDEENGIITYVQRLVTTTGQLYTPTGTNSIPPLDTNGPAFPRIGGSAAPSIQHTR